MPDDDKEEPHWANDPPPGFGPDGTSYIVDSVEELEKVLPKLKVKGPDGKLYTPEEWQKKQDGRLAKQEVEYQDEPHDGEACADCTMFVPGQIGGCTLVKGEIYDDGWCRKFEAQPDDMSDLDEPIP